MDGDRELEINLGHDVVSSRPTKASYRVKSCLREQVRREGKEGRMKILVTFWGKCEGKGQESNASASQVLVSQAEDLCSGPRIHIGTERKVTPEIVL